MYGVKEFVMVSMMGNSLFMKDGLLDECLESYLGSSPVPKMLRPVAKMTHQHPMYSIRLGEGDELVWDHPSSHPYPARGGEMPTRYYSVSGPRIYTAGSDERGLVKALVIGTNDIVHVDDTDDLLRANALWREFRPKRIVSDLTGLPEIIGATP